jgi:hypothetical protein
MGNNLLVGIVPWELIHTSFLQLAWEHSGRIVGELFHISVGEHPGIVPWEHSYTVPVQLVWEHFGNFAWEPVDNFALEPEI